MWIFLVAYVSENMWFSAQNVVCLLSHIDFYLYELAKNTISWNNLPNYSALQNTWKHPLKLDASMLTLADRGTSSKEKEIQREREKNVLAVLVFDQNAMDESPKEPEPEVSVLFSAK